MKKHYILLLIVSFIILFFQSLLLHSQIIPSSELSRQVINEVSPTLQLQIADSGFQWGNPIFIRIFKETSELEVWIQDGTQFRLFKNYHICNWGYGTLGPKLAQGDGQAPEGFYFVRPVQLQPYSNYHLAFNIGYPNQYDRAHNRTGSAIMIHGACCSIGCFAMTDSIIDEIYTLADAAFRHGQQFFRVHIFPFRMTEENMIRYQNVELINFYALVRNSFKIILKYAVFSALGNFGYMEYVIDIIFSEIGSSLRVVDSNLLNFWRNLQQGYQIFENTHIPPNVDVQNGIYVFD